MLLPVKRLTGCFLMPVKEIELMSSSLQKQNAFSKFPSLNFGSIYCGRQLASSCHEAELMCFYRTQLIENNTKEKTMYYKDLKQTQQFYLVPPKKTSFIWFGIKSLVLSTIRQKPFILSKILQKHSQQRRFSAESNIVHGVFSQV